MQSDADIIQQIASMAKTHHQWVDKMGWHNKTTTESLALIGEEVGEAIRECRGESPSDHFVEEVADIVLRIMDLSTSLSLNLFSKEMLQSIQYEQRYLKMRREQGQPEESMIATLSTLYVYLGRAISEAHFGSSYLREHLNKIASQCFALTGIQPLHDAIVAKMEKNLSTGNKGRHY